MRSNNQGSATPSTSIGRSILSFGRGQVHSMEVNHESNAQDELDAFQKLVLNHFNDLLSVNAEELLSLSWVRKLLEVFMSCQEEFSIIVSKNKARVSKSPLDKLIGEYLERSVKALDICNAIRDGIEKIRQWVKHLEIVVSSLDPQHKTMGEAKFRRARKALMDLSIAMLDEKETGSSFSHRNRSFGRHHASKDRQCHSTGHARSLSWSVSQSWSAFKQLQSIANNLVPPRGNEIVATDRLVISVFTMSFVLVFVLWALVAVIPCQDRGFQIHFPVCRQFLWGNSFVLLHERITEEGKKRERRQSNGLLKEIFQTEKCAHLMTDLVDITLFPLPSEQKEEVDKTVQELDLVCKVFNEGLDPLECQVREVFRKVMNFRTEGLGFLSRENNSG